MKKLLVVLLVMILSACGGDDKAEVEGDNDTDSSANNSDQTLGSEVNTINVNTAEVVGFAAVDGLADRLVFVQGGTLYLASFDSSEPIMLVETIHPPTILLTPDSSELAYTALSGTRGRQRPDLQITNLESLETRQIARVSSQFGFVGGWSPNNEWLIINNFPSIFVTSAAGGMEPQRVAGFGATAFWLEDNTLFVLENTFDNDGNLISTDVRRIDPADSFSEISIDPADEAAIVEAFQSQNTTANFIFFQEIIRQTLDVTIAGAVNPADIIEPQIAFTGPPAAGVQGVPERCAEWQLVRQEVSANPAEPEVLYTFPNTTFLTNLNVLDNGSVVFVRWYLVDCGTQMKAAIMRLLPDGEMQVITDDVDPGTSPNLTFFFGETGPRLSVSSDQRYAVWAGGGLEVGIATLNLTDLETGETRVLDRVERNASNSSTFHETEVFTAVLFVPAS